MAHWQGVLRRAEERLDEWARALGSKEVEGAEDALQELRSAVMRLTLREVVPQEVFQNFFEEKCWIKQDEMEK